MKFVIFLWVSCIALSPSVLNVSAKSVLKAVSSSVRRSSGSSHAAAAGTFQSNHESVSTVQNSSTAVTHVGAKKNATDVFRVQFSGKDSKKHIPQNISSLISSSVNNADNSGSVEDIFVEIVVNKVKNGVITKNVVNTNKLLNRTRGSRKNVTTFENEWNSQEEDRTKIEQNVESKETDDTTIQPEGGDKGGRFVNPIIPDNVEQEAQATEQEAQVTEQEAQVTEQEAQVTELEAQVTEQEAQATEQESKAEATEEPETAGAPTTESSDTKADGTVQDGRWIWLPKDGSRKNCSDNDEDNTDDPDSKGGRGANAVTGKQKQATQKPEGIPVTAPPRPSKVSGVTAPPAPLPSRPVTGVTAPPAPLPSRPVTGVTAPPAPLPSRPVTGTRVPPAPLPSRPVTGTRVPPAPLPSRPVTGTMVPPAPLPTKPKDVQWLDFGLTEEGIPITKRPSHPPTKPVKPPVQTRPKPSHKPTPSHAPAISITYTPSWIPAHTIKPSHAPVYTGTPTHAPVHTGKPSHAPVVSVKPAISILPEFTNRPGKTVSRLPEFTNPSGITHKPASRIPTVTHQRDVPGKKTNKPKKPAKVVEPKEETTEYSDVMAGRGINGIITQAPPVGNGNQDQQSSVPVTQNPEEVNTNRNGDGINGQGNENQNTKAFDDSNTKQNPTGGDSETRKDQNSGDNNSTKSGGERIGAGKGKEPPCKNCKDGNNQFNLIKQGSGQKNIEENIRTNLKEVIPLSKRLPPAQRESKIDIHRIELSSHNRQQIGNHNLNSKSDDLFTSIEAMEPIAPIIETIFP